MIKLVMLAREITKKEIEVGIGTERSSTRLAPIFKTLHLNIPLKNGELYTPSFPIDVTEGVPILQLPLDFIPHDTSILFGTPSINEKAQAMSKTPSKMIIDPGKGTGSPFIAASIQADKDDILISAPCDQYLSKAVSKGIKTILSKMDSKDFESGTILTTGTKNPAFSYIRIENDKAIEFMLKGIIPKEGMIAETMIVCCRVGYLHKQLREMKDCTINDLKKIYPYPENELKEIQKTLQEIVQLLDTCKTPVKYIEKCSFCDFSKIIHRLLITSMTYATVEYQQEWDDLGDWIKLYNSPIFPRDKNGNKVFAKKENILYTDCENSIIANFTDKKMIVHGLKNQIIASGPRGAINLSIELPPNDFKQKVKKIQM
ncbi:MAG: hypothetical protein U9O98_00715 [Asgard group archaeon]|nr:hypothetical protein [Asgard group archaeon]